MFVIRTIFWLIILVLLLPTNAQQQSEIYGTAQAAVKDVSGFCERNPSVCATGKEAFAMFMQKARFGAEMLMSFVKRQTGLTAHSGEGDTSGNPSDAEAPATDDNAASSGTTTIHGTRKDVMLPVSQAVKVIRPAKFAAEIRCARLNLPVRDKKMAMANGDRNQRKATASSSVGPSVNQR